MKITHDSGKLREMLNSHKDWPVVILVDSDVAWDDCWVWLAGGYSCEEGEVLDCEQDINPEHTYTDRSEFEEDVEDYVYTKTEKKLYDEELNAEVDRICKQYEPCWKKAVIVYVTT